MKALTALLAMVLAAVELPAQPKSDSYWVVEGNVRQPHFTVIHFYNGLNQQIGEYRIEGKLLSVTRKRHIRFLNRRLRQFERSDSLAIRQNSKLPKEGSE